MDILFQLDEGAYLPSRAHDTDAGMDLYTPEDFVLGPWESHSVHTGVHPHLPPNTQLNVWSKSGLNRYHDITATGLIDEGFSGEIVIRLHNLSGKQHIFKRGDMITQVVLTPVFYPNIVQVDEVIGGERGTNGYGSSGR